jgi:ribosomal protein L25 (general stress protein Ctc)
MSRRLEEFSGINTNSYLFDQYKEARLDPEMEELLASGRPTKPTSFIQTTEGIDHYMFRMQNDLTRLPKRREDNEHYKEDEGRYNANNRLNALEHGSKFGPVLEREAYRTNSNRFVVGGEYVNIAQENQDAVQTRTDINRRLLMGYKPTQRLSDVQVKKPDVARVLNTVNMRIHDPRERRFGAKPAPPPQVVSSVNRTRFSYDAANQKEMIRHGTIDLKARVDIDEVVGNHRVSRSRDREYIARDLGDKRINKSTSFAGYDERVVQVARKTKMPRESIPRPTSTPNNKFQYGEPAQFDEYVHKKKIVMRSTVPGSSYAQPGEFGIAMGMMGAPSSIVRPTQKMTARPINMLGANLRMLNYEPQESDVEYKETDNDEWIDKHRMRIKRVNYLREDPRVEENFKDDREHHNNYKLNFSKIKTSRKKFIREASGIGEVEDERWRQRGRIDADVYHAENQNHARKDTRKQVISKLDEPDIDIAVQYDDTNEHGNIARKREEFIPKQRMHKLNAITEIHHQDMRAIHRMPEVNRRGLLNEKKRFDIEWDYHVEADVNHDEQSNPKSRRRFVGIETRPAAQKKYNPEEDMMLYDETIRTQKERPRKKYADLSHIVAGELNNEEPTTYDLVRQTSMPHSLRGLHYGY